MSSNRFSEWFSAVNPTSAMPGPHESCTQCCCDHIGDRGGHCFATIVDFYRRVHRRPEKFVNRWISRGYASRTADAGNAAATRERTMGVNILGVIYIPRGSIRSVINKYPWRKCECYIDDLRRSAVESVIRRAIKATSIACLKGAHCLFFNKLSFLPTGQLSSCMERVLTYVSARRPIRRVTLTGYRPSWCSSTTCTIRSSGVRSHLRRGVAVLLVPFLSSFSGPSHCSHHLACKWLLHCNIQIRMIDEIRYAIYCRKL